MTNEKKSSIRFVIFVNRNHRSSIFLTNWLGKTKNANVVAKSIK
ncbi:unnamed protein product [Oikopleura dioica]|uniref:Uncharacterized protein n=1 Tax=Oikopleura dioica TaxID=34765 RepID=E4XNH6_OIKDI|nr:unnamed protein product [Oikopleura dioica]